MDDLWLGAVWYVVLIGSMTCHEAAHAWAAMRGGDLTAYAGGQVSLDPRPHLRREPFGMVVVPWLFFAWSGWMIGWASAPYDPAWAYAHPRRAAWMSLAGPVANLLLAIAAGVGIRIGLAVGVFAPPERIEFSHLTTGLGGGGIEALALALSLLFTLNLLLFVFNLLPVPPLDGSGVVGLFVSDDRARRIQRFMARPAFAGIGLLVAWLLIGRIFGAVHLIAINLLYPGLHYG